MVSFVISVIKRIRLNSLIEGGGFSDKLSSLINIEIQEQLAVKELVAAQ